MYLQKMARSCRVDRVDRKCRTVLKHVRSFVQRSRELLAGVGFLELLSTIFARVKRSDRWVVQTLLFRMSSTKRTKNLLQPKMMWVRILLRTLTFSESTLKGLGHVQRESARLVDHSVLRG